MPIIFRIIDFMGIKHLTWYHYIPSLLALDDGLGVVCVGVAREILFGLLCLSILLLALAVLWNSSSWLISVLQALLLLPPPPPSPTSLRLFLASHMCIGWYASKGVFLCGFVCECCWFSVVEEDCSCFKSESVFSDILTVNHADQVKYALYFH